MSEREKKNDEKKEEEEKAWNRISILCRSMNFVQLYIYIHTYGWLKSLVAFFGDMESQK